MYRDPFRASVTDCQVQQQLRRRHDSQPGARPGAIGFESGYFSPVYAPPAATPSRGPAEAALAAAAKSLSGGVPSVEHTPLAPADAPAALLQHSTPSNTFSERRVTSLTTDGGDDGDAVGGGGGGHGGGNGGGLALDGCRNLLVMCDTYAPATAERPPTPLPTNTRAAAERVFDLPNVAAEEPALVRHRAGVHPVGRHHALANRMATRGIPGAARAVLLWSWRGPHVRSQHR